MVKVCTSPICSVYRLNRNSYWPARLTFTTSRTALSCRDDLYKPSGTLQEIKASYIYKVLKEVHADVKRRILEETYTPYIYNVLTQVHADMRRMTSKLAAYLNQHLLHLQSLQAGPRRRQTLEQGVERPRNYKKPTAHTSTDSSSRFKELLAGRSLTRKLSSQILFSPCGMRYVSLRHYYLSDPYPSTVLTSKRCSNSTSRLRSKSIFSGRPHVSYSHRLGRR